AKDMSGSASHVGPAGPPAGGGVLRTFRSLRVRNYRLFASGQLVSLTGTWMQRVGQDWLVLRLSHNSGTALGVATGLQFLPLLLFGLYGGAIADRYPKRRLLVMTQSAMGVLAVALGLLDLSGVVTLGEVYVLAFLLGMATAVDNPTRQAFVTEMVGPDDVGNAVGLNSATFNSARIVGPAVAGVLIEVVGTSWVFLINALSYLGVLAGLMAMRDSELFALPGGRRAAGHVRAGLAYLRGRRDLIVPIVLVGVVGTLGFNFQVTLALIAKTTFGRGAGAYGLLTSLLAGGSLIGALFAARRHRPSYRLMVGAALTFGVLEMVVGFMPTYLGVGLLLVPTGAAALTFNTCANTTVQLRTDPSMRGRVMGVYMLVFAGGTPIGGPLVGWVAQQFGARASLWLGGSSVALVAVVIAVLLSRRPVGGTVDEDAGSLAGAASIGPQRGAPGPEVPVAPAMATRV
ncbi:MAG: MFS transporter, partial [Acidimicrobiales bacterium]